MNGVLLMALATACSPPTNAAVVGFYEGRATSKGGIGHTIELKADGTALTGSTVIVNSPYRVGSGHLFVGESDVGALSIKGETLRIQANGATQTKVRRGAGQKTSIVGVWSFEHYTGTRAYERYRADGIVEFRLPMSAYTGCYTADAGRLAFTQPQPSSSPFKLVGRTMVLSMPKKDYLYDRAERWYPQTDVGAEKR